MKPRAIAAFAAVPAILLAGAIQPPAPRPADKPIAIVGERIVTWPDLAPMLAEAAGGQALEEYALGQILREETAKRGITIGEAQTRAERTLLGQMLTQTARVPESESETLIASIRRSRGLGDIRFRALLERNAALRALVREGVGDAPLTITPEDIDTAYQLKHGPRIKARLILVRTKQTAQQAQTRLAAGAPFAEVAAELSLDPSGSRGGLLDPFSLADPTYPLAVRDRLKDMKPGETSEPMAVTWGGGGEDKRAGQPAGLTTDESGFAILQFDSTIPAPKDAPSRAAAAKDLEREVRTVRERAQMDKLARSLLRSADVSAMDPSLNWSWSQRQPEPRR